MATINFKGKEIVRNHHLTIPYHELVPDAKKSLTKKVSLNDNLIIHGDNLLALKALLPTYAGKVKCIYIDPPYNTSNEKWSYNDNVNSPMMNDWLGKVVERDDLTRHDKWLCMMMPRLKLLRELLDDDGVIFISIDDNEEHRLRSVLDEVFDEENYLNTFCWVSNLKGRQISGVGAAKTYEYILAYAKDIQNVGLFEMPVEKLKLLMPSSYKGFNYEEEKDAEGNFVVKNELYNTNSAFNEETRANLVFNIHYNFKTGRVKFSDITEKVDYKGFIKIPPKTNNDGVHKFHAWRWSRDKIADELSDLKFVKTKEGARIYTKIREYSHTNLKDIITDLSTTSGSSDIKDLFDGEKLFDFPKPVGLIKVFINQFEKDAIILDSFAGSGTTAQATLALNKDDGGKRKFILVEMEDYADKITAERVRRAIKKELGGTFSYFGLGKPIDTERILKGKDLPTFLEMARYIFYTASGEEFNEKKIDEKSGFIGESKEYKIYLFYRPNLDYLKTTALTLERAEGLGKYSGKKRLVFAPAKYLDYEHLERLHIEFAQLPFEIYQR